MAAPSTSSGGVQGFIHSLEQGNLAPVLRSIVLVVVLFTVALIYLGWKFRGFQAPEAMDQAQVAREIARGHGWSTKFIRPLAIWQIENNLGANRVPNDPSQRFPDTFNAPFPPLVNALAIKLAGNKMEFKPGEYVAPAERFIVALSMLCFIASVVVEYFLLRRLFDGRLAFFAATLTLLSDLCWQFTLSGLPQMLMLLIFNLGLYALARAIEAHLAQEAPLAAAEGEEAMPAPASPPAVPGWLAAAGVCLGLLTLSHALAVWFFLGAVVFSAVYFRRNPVAVVALVIAFAAVCTPWLVRNYQVCGSPFGLAHYALFDGLGGSTTLRMRSLSGGMTEDVPITFFRTKLQSGLVEQVGHVSSSLGSNLLALAFFGCLLHTFRRREVNAMRAAVLVMWLFAIVGMGLINTPSDQNTAVSPNQIGVLFLPVMLGFGLAFVLVLFSRREGGVDSIARLGLFAVLFLVSGLPLVFTLLPRNVPPHQYPPYLQPAIKLLGDWTNEKEIIGSDMPWAVAWYADRESLWIPNKFKDFMGLSDNAKLNGPLGGMFLTQISRNTPLFTGVLRGEFSEYQPLIFGKPDVPGFPFHEGLAVLGDPTTYVFFSDTRRWDKPTK